MDSVQNELNLYTSSICPYCKPVEYLLQANGVNFQRHEINLMKGEHRTEEYKKINPLQKVPAIIENDFILYESNVITRYLCNSKNIEERWYPKDPMERARVDLYFEWHKLNSSELNKYTMVKMGWIQNITLEQAKAATDAAFREFENLFLKNSKFVASDEVTIADLALAWHFKSLTSLGFELPYLSNEYFNNLIVAEPGLVASLEEYQKDRIQLFGK